MGHWERTWAKKNEDYLDSKVDEAEYAAEEKTERLKAPKNDVVFCRVGDFRVVSSDGKDLWTVSKGLVKALGLSGKESVKVACRTKRGLKKVEVKADMSEMAITGLLNNALRSGAGRRARR